MLFVDMTHRTLYAFVLDCRRDGEGKTNVPTADV